ncbi:MAG: ketopantoate reductase family protein [Chloracidobacterium sp.]|uniref:2-dehydropantoate 2-reductase n=1 Tax=Chloracidobacterium validum TaxID=2821543 RepID=A0ABX8B614_9BACT|nr:ketopantoate reductase family protein [Chloracidobacterium validum]QUW02412.1 ketopantoate reductase family protein [Chloracidobacterium validum]
MTIERYIVYGAGAVGSVVGGLLYRAGRKVCLMARPSHVSAIADRGLRLETPTEVFTLDVPAESSVTRLKPSPGDAILLSVKATQTAAAAAELAAHFPADTPVFCLQNGVANEPVVATSFANVYPVLVLFNAVLPEPGRVILTITDFLAVGRFPAGTDALTAQVAADLTVAGLPTREHPDAMAVKWGKLIGNLNNALLAVTDCYWQKAFADPAMLAMMRAIMDEGLRVLAAAGISPADVTGRFDIRAQVEAFAARRLEFSDTPPEQRGYPSMWQDLHFRRPETEVDYLNGEIVRLGQQYGVPTPINRALMAAVAESIQTRQGVGQFPLERLQARIAQGETAS